MALSHNPSVVTNGLVFAYDFANIKSYRGPPIQNRMTSIAPQVQSGTGYSITSGTEIVDIPTVGPTLVQNANVQNNYPSVSSNCCPSPFLYNGGGTVSATGSTLYTYAILYKVESGYTHPNYMYRYEYNASSVYLTEAGVHNDSNRVHLGNGWYWAWATFTTQATVSYLQVYSFYYRYSASFDKFSVAKILLVQGNYTSLHPKYWPNISTTRPTSQVFADLTNNNGITVVGSPTYGTAGLTIPNVNTAYLEAADATRFRMGTQNFTLSFWLKQLDNGTNVLLEARGTGLTGYLLALNYPSTGQMSIQLNTSTTQYQYVSSLSTLGFNTVQNIVAVVDRVQAKVFLYLNGVLWDTLTGLHSSSISPSSSDIYRIGYDLGSTTANYELYAQSHYNRALSVSEVLQNFNATRRRYGL